MNAPQCLRCGFTAAGARTKHMGKCISRADQGGFTVRERHQWKAPAKVAKRCADTWERRGKGLRYVFARGQCKRRTAHPSGYCSTHRYSYRWDPVRNCRP